MSLRGDKYETLEEIRMRLEGTVVTYDDRPVFISRVTNIADDDRKEISRVYFYELPYVGRDEKEVRKYLSSRKFDLSTPKMGYMNHGGSATFVSRNPIRQNQQGLSGRTTVFTDVRGKKSDVLNFNMMIASKGFVDMLDGKYPDFKDAGEMIGNEDHSSVALSRSFAFFIDHDFEMLTLLHKGIRCGLAYKGDKALRFPPKFHFLREEAEECRIPLA